MAHSTDALKFRRGGFRGRGRDQQAGEAGNEEETDAIAHGNLVAAQYLRNPTQAKPEWEAIFQTAIRSNRIEENTGAILCRANGPIWKFSRSWSMRNIPDEHLVRRS
jgi:hypothetical protein